jgi:hypothetical protein
VGGLLLEWIGAVTSIVVLPVFQAVVALAGTVAPGIRHALRLEELQAEA